jgi:hypothetical protein
VPQRQVPLRRATSQEQPNWEGDAVTGKTEDATIAKANLVEHLKNIDAACDDARLSAMEKIRRVKEEVEKAQECLKRLSL